MITLPVDISRGWMPDFSHVNMPQGGLVECKNLLPYDGVYKPAPDKLAYSTNSVEGTALSGVMYRDNGGTYRLFVGTTINLYRLETSRSFTKVTRSSGGDYTTNNNRWHWAKYGEWVLSTNYDDAIQVLKGMTTANFVPLGGSPPRAKYMLMAHGYLLLFNVVMDGVAYPNRVVQCPKDDIENWDVNAVGYSRKDFPEAMGEITGVAEFGDVSADGTNRTKFAIFCRKSIIEGYFSGDQFVFAYEPNRIKNHGAIPGTMITVGNTIYFWDEEFDIYSYDGFNLTALGAGVKETILGSLNKDYEHRITTGIDPRRPLIYWSYPTTSSDGDPNDIIVLNYVENRWAHIPDITHKCIVSIHAQAIDMDSLNVNMDDIVFDMDSNIWLEDAGIMAIVDGESVLSTLSGSALYSEIETGAISDKDKRVIMSSRVRPTINRAQIADVAVAVGSIYNEDEYFSYNTPVLLNTYGDTCQERSGRYLALKMVAGNHDGIIGMDVIGKLLGKF